MLFPRELARSWRSLGVIGFSRVGIRRDRSPPRPPIHRLGRLQDLPRRDLRPLAEDAAWRTSCAIPRSIRTRSFPIFSKADPAVVTFTQRRHRLRLRQQVEAALLHQSRRRLFSVARPVGRHESKAGSRYFVRQRHRLVGAALPGRQHAAAHRPAVRRLPFGELQHPDQDRHRMERRLRKMPRPRQRARRAPVAAPTSSIPRGSATSRPTTSASSATRRASRWRIRSRANTTTGRSASTWARTSSDFWQLEEHKLGETTLHAFRRRHRAQESHAGQRFRAERDVHARRHLLQLPRRARHRQQRRPAQARHDHVPAVPRPELAQRSAHRDAFEQHTHHAAGSSAAASASTATCPRSSRTIADVNVRSHTFKFIAPLEADRNKMPNSCTTCHTDKNVAWANDALKTWPEFSPWRVAN